MVKMIEHVCKSCGVEYHVPERFDAGRRESKERWFCPNGHGWSYTENETDKYRREAERLKQQLAEKDDAIRLAREQRDQLDRRLSATKGQVTRLKNRAANGVCPCCNRHFTNLERHMKSKHAEFAKDDNVVQLRAEA